MGTLYKSAPVGFFLLKGFFQKTVAKLNFVITFVTNERNTYLSLLLLLSAATRFRK